MNIAREYPPAQNSRYAQCFALSVLLHGAMIGLVIVLFSGLRLAPQPDAFRWQVSVVGTTSQPVTEEIKAASADPPIAQPPPVPPSVPTQNSRPKTAIAPQVRPESAATIPSRPDATPHLTPMPYAPRPAPADTTTPSSPSSVPAQDTARASPSEPSPPTVSSAPVNEPAPSPSIEASLDAPLAARVPVDVPLAPPAMTQPRTPEIDSSATSLPTIPTVPTTQTPVQPANVPSVTSGKPDFTWLTNSLRNKVKESQQYSTVQG